MRHTRRAINRGQEFAEAPHRDARSIAFHGIGAKQFPPHRRTIQMQDACAHLNAIPRQADDALYVIRAAIARQFENGDITALGRRGKNPSFEKIGAEGHGVARIAIGKLRDKKIIPYLQGRDH